MDEIFHEPATSSSISCPSTGPIIVFATTTPNLSAKPY
jgi:hypothetical protein